MSAFFVRCLLFRWASRLNKVWTCPGLGVWGFQGLGIFGSRARASWFRAKVSQHQSLSITFVDLQFNLIVSEFLHRTSRKLMRARRAFVRTNLEIVGEAVKYEVNTSIVQVYVMFSKTL